jgi:hypothetical protein
MAIKSISGTWSIGDNWPWPRMFITDYYVLAAAVNGSNIYLYELIDDGSNWTAYEVADLGASEDISNVSVASFKQYYLVAVSGYNSNDDVITKLIERKPLASPALTATQGVSSGDIPHGTAICNWRNQILIGGLKSNDVKWQHLGSCAVAYGGIGNRIFDPKTDPSSGFLKMPWDVENEGKVYQILPLRDKIAVYGSGGVEMLLPFKTEVITGFGQESIWSTGLLEANCVGGSIIGHCFIDKNYDVCMLTDNIKVLGYRRYMEALTAADIIISYDNKNQFFYISDGSLSYVLTKNGLYSTHQCVSSIGNYNGTVCGFTKTNDDDYIRLTTTEFDLGTQSLKSLEGVEVGIEFIATEGEDFPDDSFPLLFGLDDVEVYLKYFVRYNYNTAMRELDWIRLNNLGIVTRRVTGRSFKISVRAGYQESAGFNFSGMGINVQYPDKRSIRSKYGS